MQLLGTKPISWKAYDRVMGKRPLITRLQHFMFDIKPGEPASVVLGMTIGGQVDGTFDLPAIIRTKLALSLSQDLLNCSGALTIDLIHDKTKQLEHLTKLVGIEELFKAHGMEEQQRSIRLQIKCLIRDQDEEAKSFTEADHHAFQKFYAVLNQARLRIAAKDPQKALELAEQAISRCRKREIVNHFNSAGKLQQRHQRVFLADCATLLILLKETQRASQLMAEAFSAPLPPLTYYFVNKCIENYALLGNFGQVRTILSSIKLEDEYFQHELELFAAKQFTNAGLYQDALELLEKQPTYQDIASVLITIVTGLATKGNVGQALAIVSQQPDRLKPRLYAAIIQVLANIDPGKAQQVLESLFALNNKTTIKKEDDKTTIYWKKDLEFEICYESAFALACMGKPEEALKTLKKHKSCYTQMFWARMRPLKPLCAIIENSKQWKYQEIISVIDRYLATVNRNHRMDRNWKKEYARIRLELDISSLKALLADDPVAGTLARKLEVDALAKHQARIRAQELESKILADLQGSDKKARHLALTTLRGRKLIDPRGQEVLLKVLPKAKGQWDLAIIIGALTELDPALADEKLVEFLNAHPDVVLFPVPLDAELRRICRSDKYQLPKSQELVMDGQLDALDKIKEEITLGLKSEDPTARRSAWERHVQLRQDFAEPPLDDAGFSELFRRELEQPTIEPTNLLNDFIANAHTRGIADAILLGFIEKQPQRTEEFSIIASKFDLEKSITACQKIFDEQEKQKQEEEQENKLKETLADKIMEIVETIKKKIADKLGLDADQEATTSAGNNGTYGSITTGASLSQTERVQQLLVLENELVPANYLDIEEGDTIEEIIERTKTLNFLAHHEVAHLIQIQKNIEIPIVSAYAGFDMEKVQGQAEEILVDKLAFEAARKIYVHGDGDVLFDEGIREAIAIKAHLTLGKIILRNLETGKHALPDECLIRFAAVLLESADSQAIVPSTRDELVKLATAFINRFKHLQDTGRLLDEYRMIFRSTKN